MSVLLVSGGLDSAVALSWALKNTSPPHIPLSVFYGQRHMQEQVAAQQLCAFHGLRNPRKIDLAQPFAVIGGSSLTSGLMSGNPSTEQVKRTESELPPTFVPARNLVFLSIAAGIGYTEQVYEIVGGWNAVDYSGYPDCRNEFFVSFEKTVNEALGMTTAAIPMMSVHRPLIAMSKAEIIKLGFLLGTPFELTWSCYAGGLRPCGECDSCKIREEGFRAVGVTDPAALVDRTT